MNGPTPRADAVPWPSCPATCAVLGMTLDCTLPELHDLDAQPEHAATCGTHWRVTWVSPTCPRITLRGTPRLN